MRSKTVKRERIFFENHRLHRIGQLLPPDYRCQIAESCIRLKIAYIRAALWLKSSNSRLSLDLMSLKRINNELGNVEVGGHQRTGGW